MTTRATSLRNAVIDGFFFAIAMTIVAVSMSALAHGQQRTESAEARVRQLSTGERSPGDQLDRPLVNEDDTPSGDPKETAVDRRQTTMLGMQLTERARGDIRVVDVKRDSPAWQAGIRSGDRLSAVDSIRPQALAAWVDDVANRLKDRTDGSAVTAEVIRNGKSLSLDVQLPESNAAQARAIRKQQVETTKQMAREHKEAQMLPAGQAMPGRGGAAADRTEPYGPRSYRDYDLGGWGMGGFFGGDDEDAAALDNPAADDRMATAAVAQLMAVNQPTLGTTTGAPASERLKSDQWNGNPQQQAAGGQIGLAAFQNTEQGVNVAIAVRGLRPGRYQVGIGQGGANGAANPYGAGYGNADYNDAGYYDGNRPGFAENERGFDAGHAARDGRAPGQQQPIDTRFQQQQPQFAPRQDGGFQQPTNQLPMNAPQAPAMQNQGQPAMPGGAAPGGAMPTGPAGGAAPSGNGASLANPAGAYLAQQLDSSQLGQSQPRGGNGISQQPIQRPAMPNRQGIVDPRTTNPTGAQRPYEQQPGNRNGAQDNFGNQGAQPNNASGANGLGTSAMNQIGVINVDANGNGRVETRLQGMQVRGLTGMSLNIVSLDAQPVGQQPVGNFDQRGAAQRGNRMAPNDLGRRQWGASGQNIVASGVIQAVERGNAPNLGQQPQTTERPVDDATQQMRNRSQIENPREDFDPSNDRQFQNRQ